MENVNSPKLKVLHTGISLITIPTLYALSLCYLEGIASYVSTGIFLPLIMLNIFKRPASGVFSLVILLSSLKSVPDELELEVVVFTIVCAGLLVKFLIDLNRQYVKGVLKHIETKVLLAFAAMLLINSIVAMANGITPAEWGRGAVPFVFLFIYFVCMRYFTTEKDIHLSLVSMVVSSVILAMQGLFIFFKETLWIPQPFYYVPESGEWIKTTFGEGGILFWSRVTKLFPQSTDAIYLIGFFLLVILFVFKADKKRVWLALPLACGLLFLMVITYSRSFMVVMILGYIFLIGYQFYVKDRIKAKAFIAAFFFTLFFILVSVEAFDLTPFKNRYISCYQFCYTLLVKSFSSESLSEFDNSSNNEELSNADPNILSRGQEPELLEELSNVDPNILSRGQEIVIAFKMFKEKPILGNGLGVKHDIYYEVGIGNHKKFSKGYIHNWFFYFLMTSGIVGTIIYIGIYFFPTIRALKNNNRHILLTSSICSLILLNSYAMLFATFRLVTFNLLLGILISIPILICYSITGNDIRSIKNKKS